MKMRTMIALAASLLLTACAAPAEEAKEAAPAADGEAPVSQEETDTVPEPRNLLPGLDVSGLEASMPEADFAAFQAYLPVLTREETFRWVAGPYDGHPDGDWEPFDADMAAVYDRFWGHDDVEDPPGTLTLDRLAVADIVGDAEPELVLLFQDRAYNYLVFHREDGVIYGTSFYIRWFESLQETGIYMGSGGADVSYYHQLFFHDGRFWDEQLGEKIGDDCELNGREVSEAEFDAWYAANMTSDVTWYAPDGAVIPENMWAERIFVRFLDHWEVCALFSLTKRAKPHKINPLTTLMGRKAKRPAFREPAAAASRRGTFADDCSRSLLPEL